MKKHRLQTNGGNLITNYIQPKNVNRKPQNTRDQKTKVRKSSKSQQYHESSMQAQAQHSQHTQVLPSQNQFRIQEDKKDQRVQQVTYQMIMMSPYDKTYYTNFKKRTKQLLDGYSKKEAVKYIHQNCKYDNISNLKILQKLDDEQFWSITFPKMLQFASDDKKQKIIAANIIMLIPNTVETLEVRKSEVLMVIINMFLCIFPKQTNRKSNIYTLAHMMSIDEKDSQTKNSVKLQKLKCIVNYLKISTNRKWSELNSNKIVIQRSSSSSNVDGQQAQQFLQVQFKLKDVRVQDGHIQQGYQKQIMIDFANKNIGGGVLNRGAVQQQILFVCFTQLIFLCNIAFQLQNNEAIVVYGAQRYSLYEGYADSFKFVGSFQQTKQQMGPFQSVIVVVDAIHFSNYQQKTCNQYQPYYINREIKKFLCGIQMTDFHADQSMDICTGKWGCGAFGGDVYLKFLIQWIACSVANKNMTFMCSNEQERKQIRILVSFCSKFDTLQLMEIIQEYNYYGYTRNNPSVDFLTFIKKYAC